MKLFAPGAETVVVRFGDHWHLKKFHILKPGRDQTGVCGTVCSQPVYSTLGEIRASELCAVCWRFKKANN